MSRKSSESPGSPANPSAGRPARLVALAAAPVADLQLAPEAVGQTVEHEPVDQQRAGPRLAKYIQCPGPETSWTGATAVCAAVRQRERTTNRCGSPSAGALGALAGDDRSVVGLVGQRERTPVLPADPQLDGCAR